MTDSNAGSTLDARCRAGVLQIRRSNTEWLSTGWNGGRQDADCAYIVSVPDGWERTDLERYVDRRLERAGFADRGGPVLLTVVDIDAARGAQCGPVTVYATAGISNPAALPMDPAGGSLPETERQETDSASEANPPAGTVNLLVYAAREFADGALANLLTVAAEAKAATLLEKTGFPGTTTDAVIAGHDPTGPPTAFSGSGTRVGAATRACVRDAVQASLQAYYDDADSPSSVDDATYGVSTDVRTEAVRPQLEEEDH